MIEASKWLKTPVLADAEEIAGLFLRLGSFELYPLGSLLKPDALSLSQGQFLTALSGWIEGLKNGRQPTSAELKPILACALTQDAHAVSFKTFETKGTLVQIERPAILVQAHYFSYSSEENTFHSMVLGKESVFWGIQFSYPQIFLDQTDGAYREVDDSHANTALFKEIRRWSRDETRATPFILGNGGRINVPIRLGKRCFSWIHQHPQLQAKGLKVVHAS
jgi:hypothetical protein